jgi:hypothetical protein
MTDYRGAGTGAGVEPVLELVTAGDVEIAARRAAMR